MFIVRVEEEVRLVKEYKVVNLNKFILDKAYIKPDDKIRYIRVINEDTLHKAKKEFQNNYDNMVMNEILNRVEKNRMYKRRKNSKK